MSQVYYKEKGEGHPLVLVHGFCETNRIWDRFSENLADTYRVLLPDLPGFGESPLPSTPFTITDIAVKLLNWMDELQVKNPVVIGHSLGGYVTLAMAEEQPDRFPGFGLFHSTAYADSEEKKENRNKVIDFVQRNGVQPFIETFVPGLFYQKKNSFIAEVYEMASQTSSQTLVAYTATMRDRPSRERLLETYTKPILMIAGEQDTIVAFGPSSAQTNLMKFPFFRGLTDVGHMGMFENEPASLKIVKDFMNFALDFRS
jgi:pimeloyl-ACP methyl ester carboxylesterase